jgi:hypothetical protein
MQRGAPVWEAAGFLGMSIEVLQENYGHHHPDFMRAAASAITAKSRHVSVVETVVGLETFRKNRKKRNVYMVGVAGFEPATPASRTQCSTGLSHTPTRTRLIASRVMHRKKVN